MAYTTPPSGGQIQDFKVRNAIDVIASNGAVLKDLISIGATIASTSVLTAGSGASYTAVSSLAADVWAVINALKVAKLMR